ncbi:MAG: AAA family ATPase [Thalassotalea sp.]
MYTNYFGLTELPFSIAPNPDFMFMSDRHREALNHLTYGLGDTGGFVLLTGEVGTGKTTVSRCLLAQIPDNTQVAFILNPTLSSQELLATICDELKVRYRKTGATLKTLTDKIQEKLLKNHENGINTILIIDEAQHLQPEVLEQLRLLTNLETNTKKLLQVILIGQPELQQLLQRQDLRQLAQRITARYHLMPLTKQEVSQYIKHRLDVAKSPRMLFNDKAMQHIHKLSNGIPRLINLLCDRALLRAYSSNQTLVNKKTVISASYEALGQQDKAPQWSQQSMVKALVSVALVVALLVGGALLTGYWFANKLTPEAVAITEHPQLAESSVPPINVVEQKVSDANNKTTQVIDNTQTPAVNAQSFSQSNSQPSANIAPENKPSDDDKTALTNNKLADNSSEKVANIKSELELELELESAHEPKAALEPELILISSKPKPVPEFKVEAQEGVSDELLTLFQTAIEETKRLNETEEFDNQQSNTTSKLKPLMEMPQWVQDGMPQVDFQMHLYESDGKGSVKVNGEEKFVGDVIENKVKIIAIEPQYVVLNYQGQTFTLPSLASW